MTAPTLTTKLDSEAPDTKARAAHNKALASDLREAVAKASLGGPERSRERHVARGKLLPRERVERLLDPGSPFLEIGQLAANGMYADSKGRSDINGASLICSPVACMIVSRGVLSPPWRCTFSRNHSSAGDGSPASRDASRSGTSRRKAQCKHPAYTLPSA